MTAQATDEVTTEFLQEFADAWCDHDIDALMDGDRWLEDRLPGKVTPHQVSVHFI